MNTRLANTERMLLGEYRVGFLSGFGHHFYELINIYLVLQVFLFKYNSFTVYCRFINTKFMPTVLSHMLELVLFNTCIFSIRYLTAFLHLRNTRQHFITSLEAIFNSKLSKTHTHTYTYLHEKRDV